MIAPIQGGLHDERQTKLLERHVIITIMIIKEIIKRQV